MTKDAVPPPGADGGEAEEHKRFLSRLRSLPTLPIVFHKIVEMVEDPDSSADDLRGIVEKDQSVAAKVMRLANSAYFGYPRRIADLSNAIVVLGFNSIRRIALSVSLLQTLEGRKDDEFFNAENFWMHSVGVATGAQWLAHEAGIPQSERAYLAGLLHDIGKVILLNYFFSDYVKVMDEFRTQRVQIWQAEQTVLGFDHATLAGWLGDRWQFPPYLTEILRAHHRLNDASEEFRALAAAVQLADHYCYQCDFGFSHASYDPQVDATAKRLISLSTKREEALAEFLGEEKEKAEIFFQSVR